MVTILPVVARELGGLSVYAWATNAWVAAALLGQVVSGQWCDRRGPRAPMLAAVAAIAAGSLVAFIAPSFAVFLVGRAVQGLGAGVAIVAVYVLLGRAYDEELRPRAFSLLAACWVVPGLLGPVVAGWLADSVSWRLVFLIVLALVVPPLLLLVPRLRGLGGGTADAEPAAGAGRTSRRRGYDRVPYAVAAAAGLLLFQDGAQRQGVVGVLLAAGGLAVLLPSLHRLLPPGTLRFARGLPTVIAMRGLLAGALFASETWVPLALTSERGISTAASGLTLAGGAVGWAAGSWYQGRPRRALSRPRLVQLGSAMVGLTLLVLPVALIDVVPVWVAFVAWTFGTVGMGMAIASIGTLTLELSPRQQQGVNSAALQVSDSAGVVLLTGAAGAVYAAGLARGVDGTTTFTLIWWATALVAIAGAVLAGRIRSRSHDHHPSVRVP